MIMLNTICIKNKQRDTKQIRKINIQVSTENNLIALREIKTNL